MDDHMFDRVMDYGLWGLIPRFQEEYKEYETMAECPSYEEAKDFCKVLNLIHKWAYDSFTHYTPSDLLDFDC